MFWLYDLVAVGLMAAVMFGTIRREYHILRTENQQLLEIVQRQRATIHELLETGWKEQWI